MALNDFVGKDQAARLGELEEGDIEVVVRAASVGFPPGALLAAFQGVSRGDIVSIPSGLGQAKPIKINAWSFCSDHGQYADTYGMSVSDAAVLKERLRTDPDGAIGEITTVVTTALRKRGSNRPVVVTREGIPGVGRTDHAPAPGRQGGADLKAEIRSHPALYGMYKFVPEDTGRAGPLRFSVRLGGGLYAFFPNKTGAIDVARICRVLGRESGVIAGRVGFWRRGKSPLFGDDIPEKVSFDGRLKPGEKLPPDPVNSSKTETPAAE